MGIVADLQELVDRAAADKTVVGASVAVLHEGEITTAATGVLNVRTGVAATPASVFQIGSITKVWTATMIMQLVEEGRVDIDEPVITYLPEWRVADPSVTKTVTLRHLLTHTSGIDGDHFLDTGRGDDCLEKYAASCVELGQTHPLGSTLSYCNTGYSVLGRILEVLENDVWDAILKKRLVKPLSLRQTVTLPEEALRHGAAMGHIALPGSDPFIAPVWMLQRSAGPAGLICATATDLLGFAKMHIDGGKAPDGTQLLSTELVEAMQQPQADVPDPTTFGAQHWGLGWFLPVWDGTTLIGHDGATLGQSAMLRILPEQGVAVAILMNGGVAPARFGREVLTGVVKPITGIAPPAHPDIPAEPLGVDLDLFVGSYERLSVRIDVERNEAEATSLRMTMTTSGTLNERLRQPPQVFDITPYTTEGGFLGRMEHVPEPMHVKFYDFDEAGSPAYLHVGARTHPRIA